MDETLGQLSLATCQSTWPLPAAQEGSYDGQRLLLQCALWCSCLMLAVRTAGGETPVVEEAYLASDSGNIW